MRKYLKVLPLLLLLMIPPLLALAEELRIEAFADTMAPVTLIFFVLCFAAMLWYLIRSMKVQPYSYKNAAMVGGLIYIAYVTIFIIIPITVLNRRSDDLFMVELISNLATSSRHFANALMPLLIAIFLGQGISNVALMHHEGKSPRNMFGAIAGFAMIALTLLNVWLWKLFYDQKVLGYGSEFQHVFGRIVPIFFSGALCYLECVFVGMSFCAVHAARHTPAMNKDFIIIPGCAIRKDGTLFPLLQGRVDHAREMARTQEENTGKAAVFIPSGGQGADECISEAEAMKRYLLEHDVPEDRILSEDRSVNTLENMQYSRAIIDSHSEKAKVAFTTTNYHVFRTGVYAAEAGLKAEGTGSRTKWYFWPNAFMREFVALLVARRKSVLVNLLFLLVLSIIMGILDNRLI